MTTRATTESGSPPVKLGTVTGWGELRPALSKESRDALKECWVRRKRKKKFQRELDSYLARFDWFRFCELILRPFARIDVEYDFGELWDALVDQNKVGSNNPYAPEVVALLCEWAIKPVQQGAHVERVKELLTEQDFSYIEAKRKSFEERVAAIKLVADLARQDNEAIITRFIYRARAEVSLVALVSPALSKRRKHAKLWQLSMRGEKYRRMLVFGG